MTCQFRDLDTPVGTMRLVADDDRFTTLLLPQRRRQGELRPLAAPDPDWRVAPGQLPGLVAQLRAYFAGRLRDFDFDDFGLPLADAGTTFQQAVWQGLRAIPYGSTCSYADLAAAIGRPRAMRAVGAANGANPWPIIIPCHRVVAADGSLHGYGGGLALKQELLALEQG